MRDEDRIEDLMDELEEYWRSHPDLRLAQIVGNASQDRGYGKDPYFMEDSDLLEYLKEQNTERG